MGPYEVKAALCTTRAVYTNDPPAGAFRGFGVPQAAIVHEALMDMLAEKLGIDALEFRHRNALKAGSTTATGHKLAASAGLPTCLEALRPHWRALRGEAETFNRTSAVTKRGVGIGAMWYGIGNTSLSNPSAMEMGIARDGRVRLFSGAVDIGQGSNTVMAQIAADALGVPVAMVDLVTGDTDLTLDAGKTSASRQTFVSGNAAKAAGEELRRQILRMDYRDDVMTIGKLYDIDEVRRLGGIIDYVVGTPLTKVYVLAEHTDPKQRHYLNLYKMGEGPLYSFFTPYHLVHFEVPNAIARVVLFRDSIAKPLGGPVVEVCAVAKRDLKAGEVLDEYGNYMTYGEAVNSPEMRRERYLPEGLVEGCTLKRNIPKDGVLTYDDVELPKGRLADTLREEQYAKFAVSEDSALVSS